MLAYKNRTGGSLLTRAAGTGNSEVFKTVLDAFKTGLSIDEVWTRSDPLSVVERSSFLFLI